MTAWTGSTARTRVVLCFSDAYAGIARRVGSDLRSAGLAVITDQWEGGGGIPGRQSVRSPLNDCACVIALLSPSHTASTWIGPEWMREVHDAAAQRGIPLLFAKCAGADGSVPDFARSRSYARLEGDEYPEELRRLLIGIRNLSGSADLVIPDSGIAAPIEPSVMAPLTISVAPGSAPLYLDPEPAALLRDQLIPMMRDGLFFELGVKFPAPEFQVDDHLPPATLRIAIHGVPELDVAVDTQRLLVNSRAEELHALGIASEDAINPASQTRCSWISTADRDIVERQGSVTWDYHGLLLLTLSALLRRKAAAFLDVDVVGHMLHRLSQVYPGLVSECVPGVIPLILLTDVLKRLVDEQISVRDLRTILMAMAYWGRTEQDPLYLAEHARAELKRQITHKFARGSDTLVVWLLDPAIEKAVQDAMRYTPTGAYVEMPPEQLAAIVDAIEQSLRRLPDDCQVPPILTVIGIRAFIRRLVSHSMPKLFALSYFELRPNINIQPLGRITLDGFRGGRARGPRGEII